MGVRGANLVEKRGWDCPEMGLELSGDSPSGDKNGRDCFEKGLFF